MFLQRHTSNFDQSEHIMGSGSHVGFPISAKNKNIGYDQPMYYEHFCQVWFKSVLWFQKKR
jgi:hypothetical protein